MCVLAAAAAAQDRFAEYAVGNVYDLEVVDGALTGTAAGFLRHATENAQFVGIAEPHNTQELPGITTALFRMLHEAHGYRYAALETGPFILEAAGTSPTRGDEGALVGLFRDHYRSFHFFTDQELTMMADIAAISDAAISPLWGVDQVHGAPYVLGLLSERTTDEGLRARTQAVIEEAKIYNQNLGFNDSPFIVEQRDKVDAVVKEYLGAEDPRTRFLAEQLMLSTQVYRNYREAQAGKLTGLASNCEREDNMKHLFMHYYRAAREAGDDEPKVLAKLGHRHIIRGLNQNNCYSFGNFLSEFAAVQGKEAFLIAVSAINEPGRYFSLSESPEFKALTDLADVESTTLIDLRPFRAAVHADRLDVTPSMREWIFAYDAALLVGGMSRGNYRLEGERRQALSQSR